MRVCVCVPCAVCPFSLTSLSLCHLLLFKYKKEDLERKKSFIYTFVDKVRAEKPETKRRRSIDPMRVRIAHGVVILHVINLYILVVQRTFGLFISFESIRRRQRNTKKNYLWFHLNVLNCIELS